MNPSSLAVASTLAMDRLLHQEGRMIREQPGGPHLFIRRALECESIPFVTIAPSEPARVDIRIQNGEEIGSFLTSKSHHTAPLQEGAGCDVFQRIHSLSTRVVESCSTQRRSHEYTVRCLVGSRSRLVALRHQVAVVRRSGGIS